jgi:protein SCO1
VRFKFYSALLLAFVALAAFSAAAQAQESTTPAILKKVGIQQNLNSQIPSDIEFHDETGKTVRIGDYFGKKPIVLSLVYFDCPALCTEVLNGQLRTMNAISLNLGPDFEAVTVSFEPKDAPSLAKAKRDVYIGQYGRPGAMDHWHFLTGEQPSIDALTNAAGFQYAYDPAIKQYAHPAAIMVLTPEGRIARYFYGVVYPARDFRLGLVEASQGKIGTVTDHAMLYCYQYDPMTGKYGIVIINVLRIAGGLTVLALGLFMTIMFLRERKRPTGVPPSADARAR